MTILYYGASQGVAHRSSLRYCDHEGNSSTLLYIVPSESVAPSNMEYSSKKTETPIARVAHQQQLESTEHLATRRTTPTPYPMKNPRLRY
jgi:hypothetical protein